MSFLLLRGEMFHCKDCGKSLCIEFEGGAQYTQVGDIYVFRQRVLNTEYMPSDYDPEKQGYYFHKDVLCEECVKNHLHNNTIFYKSNAYEPFSYIFYCNDKFKELIEELAEQNVRNYISQLSLEKFQELNPNVFNKTIGQKIFKITSHREELAKDYLENVKFDIYKSFNNYIQSLDTYVELEKNYGEIVFERECQCRKLLEDGYKSYYSEIRTGENINLNPYICYEATVRKRKEIEGKFSIFEGPLNIPTAKIREFLPRNLWKRIIRVGSPAKDTLQSELLIKLVS